MATQTSEYDSDRHSSFLAIIITVFFISGFSGLIYQSIWSHYLKLFLGHAAYAQMLVLSIFMGGMAIGAWLISRYTLRIKNLILGYAAVELIIGLFGIIFHPLYEAVVNTAFYSLFPVLNDPVLITTFKWTLAVLLILPQSVLLGATFPLMSGGLIRITPHRTGFTLSMLYFINSLGAALGVLIAGFILIDAVGLPGTVLIAGIINIVLALIVFLLARTPPEPMAVDPNAPDLEDLEPEHTHPAISPPTMLLWITALSGLASFIYEIGWIRMLSMVLGSSTHSFELMLSAFILGLALGGWMIRKNIDHLTYPIKELAVIQIMMGLFALSTVYSYDITFDVMSGVVGMLKPNDSGYLFFNLFSHSIALLLMLPATICAGMTLPLITHILLKRGAPESAIGHVYSANTLGGIVGIVSALLILLPSIGLKYTIIFGAVLDSLLGFVLLWWVAPAGRYTMRAGMAVAGVFLMITLGHQINWDPTKLASGVFRHGQLIDKEVLFHKDGHTASIDVFKTENRILAISTNGKPDASVSLFGEPQLDEPTMILTGAIPLLHHPDAKEVAVIGMGSGITSHVALTHPGVTRVDTIEIEKAMMEGARLFGERSENVYNDPRSVVHIEDAKTYFAVHQKHYDLILSEPSNPWVSGVSSLFSEEFYRFIRHHLAEDGLFIQWLHLYEIKLELVVSIFKALNPEFENYNIFASNNGDIIIVATTEGPVPPIASSISPTLSDATMKELGRVGITRTEDFKLRFVANKAMLQPLIDSYAIRANSNFYPVVDLKAVKSRFKRESSLSLTKLRRSGIPLHEVLTGHTFRTDHDLAQLQVQCCDALLTEVSTSRALSDYFLNSTVPDNKKFLDIASIIYYTDNLKSFSQCNKSAMKESWHISLQFVASHVIPYVDEATALTMWDWLANQRCFQELTEEQQHFHRVTRAMITRDYEAVWRAWVELETMISDWEATPYHRYVSEIGMLAAFATGQYEDVLRIEDRFSDNTNFTMKILRLHAESRL